MKKSGIFSVLVIFLLIPLTLLLGTKLKGRAYYLISTLVVMEIMLPFFFRFESRRPQARELVILAVMAALAAVSRVVFAFSPYLKTITGIIMITGIAFGAEAGFLTGAVAAFASNFFFGQGPWTPWQMFAYGLGGFLAGVLYQAGLLPKKRVPLAVFGFLTVFLLVGPVLDTCAIFLQPAAINWQLMKMLYLSGVPVNLIHGLCVALTLLLVSQPMFEKLERIKDKYGMMEG